MFDSREGLYSGTLYFSAIQTLGRGVGNGRRAAGFEGGDPASAPSSQLSASFLIFSCRAVLIKRHLKLLTFVDAIAQKRLLLWPKQSVG